MAQRKFFLLFFLVGNIARAQSGLTMSYGPSIQLPPGARPSDIAMADFDHDNRLDIAITERGHDSLVIFRQLSGGSFPARASVKYYVPSAPASLVNLPLGGYGPTGASPLPPADDLAVGAADNGYFYLFDNTNTTPGALALVPRPVFLWQNGSTVPLVNPRLVTGQFNNDPWFDLGYLYDARSPHGLGGMAIPRNSTSASTIQPRIQYSTAYNPAPNFTPVDFTLADLFGNGSALGALLPSPATNEVIAIACVPPISFNAPWWDSADTYVPSFGSRPVSAAAADIDRDGGVDLVAAHETSLDLVVQLHELGGGYLVFSPNRLTYPLPVAPKQVILTDLNGDGLPELLALLADATVRVYRNTGQSGQNRFDIATGSMLLAHVGASYMRLADVNNDGYLDIVVACQGGDTVDVFYSNSRVLATAAPAATPAIYVYPNPARTTVRIALPGGQSGAVTLLDALGRVVKRWPEARAVLSVEDLPHGVYLLRVELPGGPVTRRLVLE